MIFENLLQEEYIGQIPDKTVVGIDIGSRQAKAVLLYGHQLFTALIPTGFYMQESADTLIELLLEQAKLKKEDISYIVVTGYGRVSLTFHDIPYRPVTEIACHGRGAHFLGENVRTIIDIGGQDSKVIKIDPKDGKVIDFAMNDKCAAGTGRYLEKISNVLGLDVEEIGPTSLKAQKDVYINSTCVVFAESEVVSNRAKGESVENLAAGIHMSVAKRVNGLLSRVGIESNVLFTGGVSNNIGMRKAFEALLNIKFAESKLDTVFAGALGAAVFAAEYAEKGVPSAHCSTDKEEFHLDLSSLRNAREDQKQNYINKTTGKKCNVAYTCNYTPIEVLAAANVSYMRILHKGTPDEIIAGETLTQSMLCDFNKSVAGAFIRQRPEFKAIDKLYTFFACACMRSTVEAINRLYVPTAIFNLPRKRKEQSAKEFLRREIISFKEDIEKLTGESISEEDIRRSAQNYNLAKQLIRDIANYRNFDNPLLSSSEFQEITNAYYTLPVDTLINELKKIQMQLKTAKPKKERKIRLMISGTGIAEGDTKITKIIEEELGATIVVEDSCTGIKPLETDVDSSSERDIYESLADAYLGKAPCARMFDTSDMINNSLKLAQDYKVDGVILYYLKFCPCYSMTEKSYTDLYRNADIPLFIIQTSHTENGLRSLKTLYF